MNLAFLLLLLFFTAFSANEFNANLNNENGLMSLCERACSGYKNCCSCGNEPEIIQLNQENIQQNVPLAQNQQDQTSLVLILNNYNNQGESNINTMSSNGFRACSPNDSGKRVNGQEQNILNSRKITRKKVTSEEMMSQNSSKTYNYNRMSSNKITARLSHDSGDRVDGQEQSILNPEKTFEEMTLQNSSKTHKEQTQLCPDCRERMLYIYDHQQHVDFDADYSESGWTCSCCAKYFDSTNIYKPFPMNRCDICDYDLCQFCIADMESTKNCPGKHGLEKFTTKSSGFTCDKCEEKIPKKRYMYGCETCNYDLCKNCYEKL